LPEIDSIAGLWFCDEINRPAAISALAAFITRGALAHEPDGRKRLTGGGAFSRKHRLKVRISAFSAPSISNHSENRRENTAFSLPDLVRGPLFWGQDRIV
jgi:hypothetical protein